MIGRELVIRGFVAAALATAGAIHAQGIPPGLRPGQPAPAKPSAAVPLVQATIPATPPTTQMVTATESHPAPVVVPIRRAKVIVSGGRVTITADNSSLNQILRELARQTGMKITGGVNDERVYGKYGPDDLGAVLATLLDGTGSNMMLMMNERQVPQELILTPRQGGASPPNPMSGQDVPEERDPAQDLPPQLSPRVSNVPGSEPVTPAQPQPFAPPTVQTQQDPATTAPAAGTTTDQSPNGVKTPQQIFDQLMKMQQQNAKPPAPQ